ncbi:PREDICTED: BRCA1-A complex subunit BRE-like [Dufourea novaeangliae]|uniref:BRCA1-A complex subunit BRE-like n=1 Tax=Dufourea novaeangliae TaxID=178035 RepID=UPI0007670C05|nr:PREDICTED: BRCA1-A complex subunit BRE-like [Dufourea novaeangliae]
MLNQQYNITHRTDSYIEPLLKRVLEMDVPGLCRGSIQVQSISSSCGKARGDRFKLCIPYAKQTLNWNVFFDSQCPEMGPDFIFNDDTFLMDMNIDTLSIKVPSLAKWNLNDRNALLNVLMELLACYKEHQIQLLQKQDRLKLEYSMLIDSSQIAPGDVEIILLPFASKPTEAKFLITLLVDLSQLQNYGFELENETAMLLITFSGPNWNRIQTHLHISKFLQPIVGNPSTLQLQHFPSDKCLMDYVLEAKMCIAEKINSFVQRFKSRRLFVSTLISLQPGATIEYDSLDYSHVSVLLNDEDFHFVVHFFLPSGYPQDIPEIELQSIYHMTKERSPFMRKFDVPYAKEWKPLELIKKICAFIKKDCVKNFKRNSIENCS